MSTTKYRKDLTGEEFQTAKHFKWLLLHIATPEERIEKHYAAQWRVESGVWKLDRLRETTALVVFLSIADFRKVAKAMEISEGRLLDLLGKFSMICLPTDQKDGPKRWTDTGGQTFVGLDKRLSAVGRIGRDPSWSPKQKTTIPADWPTQKPNITRHERLDGTVFYRDDKGICDEHGNSIYRG